MRPTVSTVVGLAIAVAVPLAGCAGGQTSAPRPPSPTSAQVVREVGLLGRPLGTHVTVSGVAVSPATGPGSGDGEVRNLRITSVDGKTLPAPVELPYARHGADVSEPTAGQPFTYRGFERLGFGPIPISCDTAPPNDDFREFVVLPEKGG